MNRERLAAVEAVEMVAIAGDKAINCFTVGHGKGTDKALNFEGFEGTVDRSESNAMVLFAQLGIDFLGGDRPITLLDKCQNPFLIAR